MNFLLMLSVVLALPAYAFEPFVDALPIPKVIKADGKKDITIKMSQIKTKIHRDLPEATQWGYAGTSPGPTIEVESGQKIRVHWVNNLPKTHLFKKPEDMNMGGGSMPDVRAVVHLHGAAVTQDSITDKLHNNDGWPDAWLVPGEQQIAEYPNAQTARLLWYHDHAMAETGRNVAAGLTGLYVIRDAYERSLNLPSGKYEIPLMFQPRGLNADGSLYYVQTLMKEHYGNSLFVNGKLYPYLNVEPRKYRFRFLNASNARTMAFRLVDFDDNNKMGPAFYQIGSDSGFLENTVVLNDPENPNASRLVLAPAERADIIIDFSKFAGRKFILHNNQRPDDPDAQMPLYRLMMFKVADKVSKPDTSSLPMKLAPIRRMSSREASKTRQIVFGDVMMGDMDMLLLNGKYWHDPVEEAPKLGATEQWELINTLIDAHPFHIHLVEFQVLNRQEFDVDEYTKSGKVVLIGDPIEPEPGEMGWKDTVRVIPRHITRIITKFGPFAGHYVYHCHILEHEDMDMMRPFDVVP